MAVEPFSEYGTPGVLDADGPVVATDAELGRLVSDARRRGVDPATVGLLGGDLCRTLGGRGSTRRLREGGTVFPVDLGSVLIDGRIHWFVAHLVVRRRGWQGAVIAVMNAEWIGRWDVAPRAHPGDGRLDVVEADLGLAERLKAWRRLPTGTHLPHPQITTRSVSAAQFTVPPRASVWLDGVCLGSARNLSIRVEPDALEVVV